MNEDLFASAKKRAALKAAEAILPGMTIGLGTGTTAHFVIEAIGEKMKAGWNLQAVASSVRSEELARSFGIPIIDFSSSLVIDLYLDGADEVDVFGNLIKGGGGALVREKILASNSKKFVVMVDESKMVRMLGNFPLPVEVVPFAYPLTLRRLESLGCRASLRRKDGVVFRSDNGNYIADCVFDKKIGVPVQMDRLINAIPGVVESGLFGQEMAQQVITGYRNGEIKFLR